MTSQNYDQLVKSHELVVINFYADWCRFSQILAPVFEEAAHKIHQEFQTGQVLFARIDCETETDLSTRFHVSKYPTIKQVMNGKPLKKEYRGQRSVEAIVNHVKKIMEDPVQSLVTYDQFKKIDDKKAAIIGYFKALPASIPEYGVFRKVAIDLRDDCHFYWVTGESSVIRLKGDKQFSLTFKPSRSYPGEADLEYPGSLQSYDELSSWATDKCIPLVREITFENAEELTEEGLPFLILFHKPDDKDSVEAYTNLIHRELYTESSSVNFLIADGVKFAHPLHHLGKSQSDLPLIAIDSFRHMYLFPNFKDLQ
jgi:endoplasmic reticulum resident protein 44